MEGHHFCTDLDVCRANARDARTRPRKVDRVTSSSTGSAYRPIRMNDSDLDEDDRMTIVRPDFSHEVDGRMAGGSFDGGAVGCWVC